MLTVVEWFWQDWRIPVYAIGERVCYTEYLKKKQIFFFFLQSTIHCNLEPIGSDSVKTWVHTITWCRFECWRKKSLDVQILDIMFCFRTPLDNWDVTVVMVSVMQEEVSKKLEAWWNWKELGRFLITFVFICHYSVPFRFLTLLLIHLLAIAFCTLHLPIIVEFSLFLLFYWALAFTQRVLSDSILVSRKPVDYVLYNENYTKSLLNIMLVGNNGIFF